MSSLNFELENAPVAENNSESALPEEIDCFLSDFAGQGYTISLHRKTPLYCAGYLGVYQLDSSFTLQSIKETWGGKEFVAKIKSPQGKIVTSRMFRIGDVPRIDGRPLNPSMEYADGGQTVVSNPADKTIELLLAKLDDGRKRQDALLMKMMEQQTEHARELRDIANAEHAASKSAVDPMAQIHEAIELINEMKAFTASQDGSDGGMDSMKEIFGMFREEMTARRAAQENGPTVHRQRISLPGPSASSARSSASNETSKPAPQAALKPVDSVNSVNSTSNDEEADYVDLPPIEEELAELGPEKTAEAFMLAMDRWTPEQQKAAIDSLLGKNSQNVDESSTKYDNCHMMRAEKSNGENHETDTKRETRIEGSEKGSD